MQDIRQDGQKDDVIALDCTAIMQLLKLSWILLLFRGVRHAPKKVKNDGNYLKTTASELISTAPLPGLPRVPPALYLPKAHKGKNDSIDYIFLQEIGNLSIAWINK